MAICYPLVNIQKTIENCHRNSVFSKKNGDFPLQNVSLQEGMSENVVYPQ